MQDTSDDKTRFVRVHGQKKLLCSSQRRAYR